MCVWAGQSRVWAEDEEEPIDFCKTGVGKHDDGFGFAIGLHNFT